MLRKKPIKLIRNIPIFPLVIIIFSIVGVVVLYTLTIVNLPPKITLDKLSAYYDNRKVRVEALVISTEQTRDGDLFAYLFDRGKVVRLQIPYCQLRIEFEDIIECTALVRKYGTDYYELIAESDKVVKVVKHLQLSEYIELADLETVVNHYVKIYGIVKDKYTLGYGYTRLILTDDNRTEIMIFIRADLEATVEINDLVEVHGIVRSYQEELELEVYDKRGIQKLGHVQIPKLTLPELSETIPILAEYQTIVNVTGYIKYEPLGVNNNSLRLLYLTETPLGGRYSLKVTVSSNGGSDDNAKSLLSINNNLHKGDLVAVIGRFDYERARARYRLIADRIILIEQHPRPWQVLIEDLANYPYEFDNVYINVSEIIVTYIDYVNKTAQITTIPPVITTTTDATTTTIITTNNELQLRITVDWNNCQQFSSIEIENKFWLQGIFYFDRTDFSYKISVIEFGYYYYYE